MSASEDFQKASPEKKIPTVTIFAGSRTGVDPADQLDATYVGAALGLNGILLAYGGGDFGNMGHSSRACLEAGGQVKGYNLSCFTEAHDYPQKSYELICRSIAIRKEEMLAVADAYIALAGGLGTIDEVVDAMDEQYLGHLMTPPVPRKPIILINRGGLYDLLPAMLQQQVKRGYTKPEVINLLTLVPDGPAAIQEIARHYERKLRLPDVSGPTPGPA